MKKTLEITLPFTVIFLSITTTLILFFAGHNLGLASQMGFGFFCAIFWPGWIWTYAIFSSKQINITERLIWSLIFSIIILIIILYLGNTLFGLNISASNTWLIIINSSLIGGIIKLLRN